MADEKLDPDFANLPSRDRAEIVGLSGVDPHHAPAASDGQVTGEAFRHPEQDRAGTTWQPDWEPIETYRDGEVVMLDDGGRQLLGKREMGMWVELVDGDERAQPDCQPLLWSYAPDRVKDDMT